MEAMAKAGQPVAMTPFTLAGAMAPGTVAGALVEQNAEALAGIELRIPESELQPLAEGTFYHHQLVGCEVVTETGDVIGPVTKVDDGAGSTLLVVQGQDGEVLIPLVQEMCTAIVPAERRIVVTLPPGLLELNEKTRPSRA